MKTFFAAVTALAIVSAACQAPRAGVGAPASPSSAASAAATAAEPDFTGKTLNIATGATGAVYIIYGAGIADQHRARPEGEAGLDGTCRLGD